jgi:hypothetical protein
MSNFRLMTATIVGAMFGLSLPLVGASGPAFLMTMYWTIVLFLFGAYVCQELRDAFTKKE